MSKNAIQRRENQQVNVPEHMDQGITYAPLVDVIETSDAFIFQADLPGVRPGDVDVSYENGVLTIAGRPQSRQSGRTNYIWQEYGVGSFYRQFSLNTAIDPDKIKAELRNGVLELHVPKAESARARKIDIKSA